ncbi:MAG: lysophospholipid acyltransferase family protein [Chthoniobacterales bacterium]
MKLEGWRARLLIAFGFRLLQLWARTLRFEIDDRAGVLGTPPAPRYIGACWHNRLFVLPHVIRRYLPQRRGVGLISASRDGAILADIVQRFGFDVVRGSSSRKGVGAMLQLADVMANGRDAVITPDGPRGPAYEIGPGIVFLAQKSGAAVVPINMEYSSCWRLKSWDRFILPRPFSTVRAVFGTPHIVPATATDEEFEFERVRLQNAMMQLVEMR